MTKPILDTPAGKYRWHEDWAVIPDRTAPVGGRTHGIAVARSGRVYVFHQAVPSILVYTPDGQLVDSWGEYPGAHGLTLVEEDGEEFLWLTDQKRQVVEKTTLDGKIVRQISPPAYAASERYVPTWVAVNETRHGGNGDIWIADGYGSSRVLRFNSAGEHLSTLDGEEGAGRFQCPHGIWFDGRKHPMELYIADRANRRVQIYNADGQYLRSFGEDFLSSPDGFAHYRDTLIVPELQGRITILDAADQLVCHLGANEAVAADPLWPDRPPLEPGRFNSPHAAAADTAGNIFVVEWRAGGRILKLEKL